MSAGTAGPRPARVMPGTTAPRNGLPPVAGYVYRGTGRDTLTPPHVMAAWARRDPEAAQERARNPRPQDGRLATDRVLDAIAAAGGEPQPLVEVRLRVTADGGPELSSDQVFGALYKLAARKPAAANSSGRGASRRWRLGPGAPAAAAAEGPEGTRAPAAGPVPPGPPAAAASGPADEGRPERLAELEAQLTVSGVIAPAGPPEPEPSPPAVVKRCKGCGYMETAPGHKVICGSGS